MLKIESLRGALAVKEEPPRPVDVSALKTALSAYKTLPRNAQKEFWSRVIKKIIITKDERITLVPVSPYNN